MASSAMGLLPVDRGSAKEVHADDWTGITDQKRRKQLQNRLNQRAYKERIRQSKLARAFGQKKNYRDSAISWSKHGRLQVTIPKISPTAMWPVYPLECQPDFLVDPVVKEVIMFARDTLWPTFSAARKYPTTEASLNEMWFYRILNVPIMRNAVIAGTCMDIELLTGRRYSSTISRTIIELSREVRRVISQLPLGNDTDRGAKPNQSQSNHSSTVNNGRSAAMDLVGPTYVDDDLLFAVMHLVKASTINSLSASIIFNSPDTTAGTFGFFTPPVLLQRLQSLHLWGRSCPYQTHGEASDARAAQHLAALEYLVSLKGGLRNIKTPGFSEAFHLFDVMESAKRLKSPKFELPKQSVRISEYVEWLRRESPRGPGFCELDNILRGSSLLNTLEDLHILCSWFSADLDSRNHDVNVGPQDLSSMSMPSTEDLTTLRNLVEYRLLAFVPTPYNPFEVFAHTAALIFMHGIVFPLPKRGPMQMLIQRLIERFQDFQLHLRNLEEQRFLVWVLMMGAMATSEADVERLFFIERLAMLVGWMGISSWGGLKKILSGYLWVDWGCDAGGMDVWRMFEHGVRSDSTTG